MRMRATVRDGELTLVPRQLATVTGGPIACLARAAVPADASLADLKFGVEAEDEDEEVEDEEVEEDGEEDVPSEPEDRTVEVRFLANDRPDARRTLKRWAAWTGHERIWFRDEVCDLESPAAIDCDLGTTCPSCGLEITDSGPGLIGFVRRVGHFPLNCFVCGTFVPQWTPVRSEASHPASRRVEPAGKLRVVGAKSRR
jgi:hypothetical protein